MINFLFSNIKSIGIGIIAFIGIYILRKNKILACKNQILTEDNNQKDKVISIQNEVLDATEKIEPADLDGSLDRLSDKNK